MTPRTNTLTLTLANADYDSTYFDSPCLWLSYSLASTDPTMAGGQVERAVLTHLP